MKLRKLKVKDVEGMLEWMHDEYVVNRLRNDFVHRTEKDCQEFINKSYVDIDSLHMAICSDDDEYMGTVSLKKIDKLRHSAEMAIVVRRVAMGKGYAWFGLSEILRVAFDEYEMENVYWCVSKDNERAVRFFDKHGFHENVDVPSYVLDDYERIPNLKWYSVLRGDAVEKRQEIVGCKILSIKTKSTLDSGELSFFEGNRDIGFTIKRVYYISKAPKETHRGFHAHKKLKQLLFCPYGRIRLILENENGREEIILSDPSIGVVIDIPTWRETVWLQKDSVLCVAASDYYDEKDYIREYDEFVQYISNRKK